MLVCVLGDGQLESCQQNTYTNLTRVEILRGEHDNYVPCICSISPAASMDAILLRNVQRGLNEQVVFSIAASKSVIHCLTMISYKKCRTFQIDGSKRGIFGFPLGVSDSICASLCDKKIIKLGLP